MCHLAEGSIKAYHVGIAKQNGLGGQNDLAGVQQKFVYKSLLQA